MKTFSFPEGEEIFPFSVLLEYLVYVFLIAYLPHILLMSHHVPFFIFFVSVSSLKIGTMSSVFFTCRYLINLGLLFKILESPRSFKTKEKIDSN